MVIFFFSFFSWIELHVRRSYSNNLCPYIVLKFFFLFSFLLLFVFFNVEPLIETKNICVHENFFIGVLYWIFRVIWPPHFVVPYVD